MIFAILIITNLLTLTGCVVAIQRSLTLVEKIDEISSQVEESLDLIDESYANVSRHLKSPVLFDDPVVVTMVRDVKQARDAMLLIANKVTEPFSNETGSDEEGTT
jgi:DNA-binding transcriptional ArsR family regulator